MTIGADAAIEYFGTQDTLGTSTSAVTANSFSAGTSDIVQWTNDDDAPLAAFVLEFTTATTGTAGSVINLYAQLNDIGNAGNEDTETPDSNFPQIFLGSFPHNNPATTAQTATFVTNLPNVKTSQKYNFYIENKTGQTISAGWDLHVTPLTIGPHA